jgi:hypothetical protein
VPTFMCCSCYCCSCFCCCCWQVHYLLEPCSDYVQVAVHTVVDIHRWGSPNGWLNGVCHWHTLEISAQTQDVYRLTNGCAHPLQYIVQMWLSPIKMVTAFTCNISPLSYLQGRCAW